LEEDLKLAENIFKGYAAKKITCHKIFPTTSPLSNAMYVIIAAMENTMCYQAFNENENRVDVHYQVFIQDRPTRKVEIF